MLGPAISWLTSSGLPMLSLSAISVLLLCLCCSLVLVVESSGHPTPFPCAFQCPTSQQQASYQALRWINPGQKRRHWPRYEDNRRRWGSIQTENVLGQNRPAIHVTKRRAKADSHMGNDINDVPATSKRKAQELSASPPPVYITIGPPCCGKTEALRSYLLSEGHDPDIVFTTKDVALDDGDVSPDVYHKIPLATYLFPSMTGSKVSDSSSAHDKNNVGEDLLKSGSTVSERLIDPKYYNTDQELRNIILRIAGRITPQEFASRIRKQAKYGYGDTVKYFQQRRIATGEALILAVEAVSVQAISEVICQMQLMSQQQQASLMPKLLTDGTEETEGADHEDELPYENNGENGIDNTSSDNNAKSLLSSFNATQQSQLLSAKALIGTRCVDLFIPHAIFNGGLDRAKQTLFDELKIGQHTLLHDGDDPDGNQRHHDDVVLKPVIWGNTNTRPMEYVVALEAAEKFNRPVRFVPWGTSRLPRVTRQELLRRNVSRFRKTGRYIPSGAISAALGRVETLIKEAQKVVDAELLDEDDGDNKNSVEFEGICNHKMDVALAGLAGYRMDQDGYVVKVGEPKNWKRQKKKKLRKAYHEPRSSSFSNRTS